MDVIDLVSSDEEDNNGSIKNKLKNRNLVVKRVRIKPNVNKIPMQRITAENHHQKNNNVLPTTYLHTAKKHSPASKQQQQPPPKPLQQQKQVIVLKEPPAKQHTQLRQPQVPQVKLKQQPQKPIPAKQAPLKQTTLIISPTKMKDGTISGQLNLASSGVTITPIKNSNSAPLVHVNLLTPSPIKADATTLTAMPRSSPSNRHHSNNAIAQPVQLIQANQPIKPVNAAILKPAKRVVPFKISDTVTRRASSMEKSSDSDMLSRDSLSALNDETPSEAPSETSTKINGTMQSTEPAVKRRRTGDEQKRPLSENFVALMSAFRAIDPAKDMEKIISKLEKYYQRAHIEYINSKSFKALIKETIEKVQQIPKNIYVEINRLMEELKTRRVIEFPSVSEETKDPQAKEVDVKKTKQIEKLNKTLKFLQARIRKCEEAEVDWNDELNSKYLETERYKKRAWEIYEKLCDITGESRDARRIINKPIRFKGTGFNEFNQKLERYINESKRFPDMFDVLQIIDHCNKHFNYRLSKDQRKTLAQDAFQQVGVTLQKRRRHDLYEMVTYFTGTEATDPAAQDPNLKTKLEENQRHYSKRMDEVIQKFTLHNGDSEANDGEGTVKTEANDREEEEEVGAKATSTVKREQSSSREASPMRTIEPPAPVVPLIEDSDIITANLNLDADIDMLHNSVTFIDGIDIAQDDGLLIEEPLVQELQKEFYPTITSVTSLHPRQFNDFMNFEQKSLDSSNTKIL